MYTRVRFVAFRHGGHNNAMQRRVLGFDQIDPFDIDRSVSVQESLNAAPAALLPIGAA